jgi:hypothetical protein
MWAENLRTMMGTRRCSLDQRDGDEGCREFWDHLQDDEYGEVGPNLDDDERGRNHGLLPAAALPLGWTVIRPSRCKRSRVESKSREIRASTRCLHRRSLLNEDDVFSSCSAAGSCSFGIGKDADASEKLAAMKGGGSVRQAENEGSDSIPLPVLNLEKKQRRSTPCWQTIPLVVFIHVEER